MHIYSAKSAKVAIVGITGYTGQELDRLLAGHPHIQVAGRFATKADATTGVMAFSSERLRAAAPDVVVLATEHDVSLEHVPLLLESGFRVLDMSGAFRLKDASLYPEWYGFSHTSPHLLEQATYGLPEFFAADIRKARLVANPGCYATAAVLPLLPLYRAGAVDTGTIAVVDGKSGVSGAGRKPKPETHFCEVSDNIRAYGVLQHRHTPEMLAMLPGANLENFVFTPHLIPIARGILNTIVVRLKAGFSAAAILADTYSGSEFVRLSSDRAPAVHDVVRTNLCSIGISSRGATTVLVSAIDNLVKGAAGQALQNLNLMLGFKPADGLLR